MIAAEFLWIELKRLDYNALRIISDGVLKEFSRADVLLNITDEETGKFLLVANQDSNNVIVP